MKIPSHAAASTLLSLAVLAHFASAFISRLPVSSSRSAKHGGRMCATPPPGAEAPGDEMLQRILSVGVAAAKEGGKLIREKAGASIKETKSNEKDLVTEVDSAVQKVIERHVYSAFPDHSFLGEESVDPGPDASARALEAILSKAKGWIWVVDPIDGTTNFVHGMPLSAVSIGVAYGGQLLIGVIYDPFMDECFTAVRGKGARVNEKEIRVGKQDIGGALVAAGSPPNILSQGPSLRGIHALMPKVRSIRLLGSAAIMLAWIACGRLTAYFEPDLNSWDTAAGSVLVEEAGGRVTSIVDGKEYQLSTRSVLASNGVCHDDMLQVLQSVDAGRLDPPNSQQDA